MSAPRHPLSWPLAAAAVTLAIVTGCCHPRPLGYVPRAGKFEQPLLTSMVKASTNEFLNVVATLRDQVSEADKRRLCLAIKAANRGDGLRQQRRVIVEELKRLARQTQTPVLERLRALEQAGLVKGVRSLWIANVIAAQVSPLVISNLAAQDVVTSLHLDSPRPGTPQADGSMAKGLKEIGLPSLPESRFQSEVVVALIDSGVDWHHLDLTNRIWTNAVDTSQDGLDQDQNGYPDDLRGWNFSAGTNDPTDTDGHGTHVAGIVAGEGMGSVRTGVAPQARIMALRRTDKSNRSTEQECWEAMQYALENGAHVINFSSGWTDDEYPDFAAWRTAIQNVTDAGVLFVTAAGNSGNATSLYPVPFNVTIPGRVPAALTVGSCEAGNSVRTSSGRGTVTWTNVEPFFDYPDPPGLMKPELVAPGANIESTKRGGGYEERPGTSMAAPHVAGVAALLLGRNPELNPYELRYILEESASGFTSEPRPNPDSGWGHLNAPAAVSLSIDPAPFDLSVKDLRVAPSQAPGQAPLLFATVTNLGGQVVGNAEMRFYLADAPDRTVADLDADGDGMPDEARFRYIGSHFVPVLGPGASKHGSFEGVVRWTNSVPATSRWWLGVWVLPGATSGQEVNPRNNASVMALTPGGF